MSAPAIIKQADLKRIAAVAKSENVAITFEIGGGKFTVSPVIQDIHSSEALAPSLPSGSNALSEWRRLNESRFGGRSSRQKETR